MADYRRKVSLELDSNAEKQVRELINEYSNSISNHPFQDLGDKIKIKVYDRCNIYIPQVKTEFDQRTVSEQKKPYDGRSVSARTVMTLTAVDPWSFDLLNTDSFTNQQKEFIVSGSQHVEPCSKCGRKGTMICYDCHGLGEKTCSKCDEGTVTCSECRGAGKTKCPRCNGKGKISESVWVPELNRYVTRDRECPNRCDHGYIRCGKCNGRGSWSCPDCGGKGKTTCKNCNGDGIITCSGCGGKKDNLYYYNIDQSLIFHGAFDCVYDSRLGRIPELVGRKSHTGTVAFALTGENPGRNLIPEDREISSHLDSLIDSAKSKCNRDKTILFQEAKVLVVDVKYIEYSFNGNTYCGAIAYDRFYAGNSPIKEYTDKMVKYSGSTIDGIHLMFWTLALSVTPFLFEFYSKINPVLPFAVKTNDPDWNMYNALPITQCVIFLFALWFVRMKLLRKDYSSLRYGTVWGFLGAGMLKLLLPALGVLAGLLLLNYLGLSLLTTDILWIIIIAWIVILIRSKKKK